MKRNREFRKKKHISRLPQNDGMVERCHKCIRANQDSLLNKEQNNSFLIISGVFSKFKIPFDTFLGLVFIYGQGWHRREIIFFEKIPSYPAELCI